MKKFIQLSDGLAKIVDNLCGVLILFMSLAVVVSVVGRAALNLSYDWLEELCRYIHILNVMLGIGIVTYRGDQIVMDLIYNKVRGRAQIVLNLFNHVCIFVFCVLGGVWGIQRVVKLYEYGGKTSSKAFYSWQPMLTVPVGFIVGAILTLAVIVKIIYQFRTYHTETRPEAEASGLEEEGD